MRQTSTHKKLLHLLRSAPHPVSANDLLRRIPVNKTTIYRQLEALCRSGLISPVRFSDRKTRYELADRGHHHHLICTGCNAVSDITLPEGLEKSASQSAAKNRFLITSHYLEFFGLCQKCRQS